MKKKKNLRTDLRHVSVTHTSSIRNSSGHELTLIKPTAARFVGTGCFLITYPVT